LNTLTGWQFLKLHTHRGQVFCRVILMVFVSFRSLLTLLNLDGILVGCRVDSVNLIWPLLIFSFGPTSW
jgi:hypothetical protein